jgi:hypothetical protein
MRCHEAPACLFTPVSCAPDLNAIQLHDYKTCRWTSLLSQVVGQT